MAPYYEGQRVRLTEKLCVDAGLIQGAVGIVEKIVFDRHEGDLGWQKDLTHPAWERGYYTCTRIPEGIWVYFENARIANRGMAGLHPTPGCREQKLFFIKRTQAGYMGGWAYHYKKPQNGPKPRGGNDKPATVYVDRSGIHLIPENDMTVQAAQGKTTPAALLFLAPSMRMDAYEWWEHVYTELSRCTTHENMLLLDHPPKLRELLTLGPSGPVRQELERLDRMAMATHRQTTAIRRALGWPAPGPPTKAWQAQHAAHSAVTVAADAAACALSASATALSAADAISSAVSEGPPPKKTGITWGLHGMFSTMFCSFRCNCLVFFE